MCYCKDTRVLVVPHCGSVKDTRLSVAPEFGIVKIRDCQESLYLVL